MGLQGQDRPRLYRAVGAIFRLCSWCSFRANYKSGHMKGAPGRPSSVSALAATTQVRLTASATGISLGVLRSTVPQRPLGGMAAAPSRGARTWSAPLGNGAMGGWQQL